jgi:hypothetical protein
MVEWIINNGQAIIIIFVIIALLIVVCSLFWPRDIIITKKYKPSMKRILGVYYLPETLIQIKVNAKVLISSDKSLSTVTSQLIGQEFEVSTLIQADTSQAFVLQHVPNPFSINEYFLTTNEKGLLENMNATSDSQTPEIFSFFSKVGTQASDAKSAKSSRAFAQAALTEKIEIRNYERIFHVRVEELLNVPPTKREWKIQDTLKGSNILFPEVEAGFKVELEKKVEPKNLANIEKMSKNYPGLVFRIRALLEIKIESLKLDNTLQKLALNCIHPGYCYIVPVRSTPFVKRTHELSMVNGELVSHKLTIPSSVEGFISIPINLAKAIVSIPAQLLSLKVDFTSKKKELEELIKGIEQTEYERKESSIASKLIDEESALKREREILNSQKKLTRTETELAEIKIRYAKDLERLEHEKKKLLDQLAKK